MPDYPNSLDMTTLEVGLPSCTQRGISMPMFVSTAHASRRMIDVENFEQKFFANYFHPRIKKQTTAMRLQGQRK